MIGGDQHLGTVLQHGIDEWNDAPYSFAMPAIANYWTRWWKPDAPGNNHQKGAALYTGEYLDGLNNKITVHAVANPTVPESDEGGKLKSRAAGYGIVRYNKPERTITFECWGRNVDITDPESEQYDGWPITVKQENNYRMKNGFLLPTLEIGKPNQVVTIIDSNGELISSVRVQESSYQPRVPYEGSFTIQIGEGTNRTEIRDIDAKKKNSRKLRIGSD
jgi:hypothetical protein